MPTIRYAVASGNWSDVATWDGGTTLPSSGDDVYANNKTVSIDQTITVNSLKRIANVSPAITTGGAFAITASAATVTITAGISASDTVSSSARVLQVGAAAGTIHIITPTIVGSALGSFGTAVRVNSGYSDTVTIDADITGGSASNALGVENRSSDATIIINGNVTGGAGGESYGLFNSDPGASIEVNGDIAGSANGNSQGFYNVDGSATVRGDLYPGNDEIEAIISQSSSVLRYAGTIHAETYWPLVGRWTTIAGEDVSIEVVDDSDFPASNSGTPVTLGSGGGGGGSVPTTGVLWPPRYWG